MTAKSVLMCPRARAPTCPPLLRHWQDHRCPDRLITGHHDQKWSSLSYNLHPPSDFYLIFGISKRISIWIDPVVHYSTGLVITQNIKIITKIVRVIGTFADINVSCACSKKVDVKNI